MDINQLVKNWINSYWMLTVQDLKIILVIHKEE